MISLAKPRLFGKFLLTDAQNVFLRGPPKPVPKQEKSMKKHGGRALKSLGTHSIGESMLELTSSKLIKKFFIFTSRNNTLWQDDCDAVFEEYKNMYGTSYYFGMETKYSINIMNIIYEAPMEMQVHSLEL
jgi:hypothetical protein